MWTTCIWQVQIICLFSLQQFFPQCLSAYQLHKGQNALCVSNQNYICNTDWFTQHHIKTFQRGLDLHLNYVWNLLAATFDTWMKKMEELLYEKLGSKLAETTNTLPDEIYSHSKVIEEVREEQRDMLARMQVLENTREFSGPSLSVASDSLPSATTNQFSASAWSTGRRRTNKLEPAVAIQVTSIAACYQSFSSSNVIPLPLRYRGCRFSSSGPCRAASRGSMYGMDLFRIIMSLNPSTSI